MGTGIHRHLWSETLFFPDKVRGGDIGDTVKLREPAYHWLPYAESVLRRPIGIDGRGNYIG